MLNLQWLGVEAFCPHLRQFKIIHRRKATVISPLFPGYLFSKFDQDTKFCRVNYAPGVDNVVTFGSIPALVEEEIIASIKARIQNGYVHRQSPSFKVWQGARISNGPFPGVEALFQKNLSGSQRVALLLKTLSYQVRVILGVGSGGLGDA